ncbi:hypothetical protein Tco_0927986 [Tanacetum coccineum]
MRMGIMPTKVELTLEQSKQCVSKDVLDVLVLRTSKHGRSLRNWRYKQRCCSLIPAESDSLPHAHAQTTKTHYKHQDSRIKKAQEIKTKTSATLIFKIFLKDIKIIKTKIVKEDC